MNGLLNTASRAVLAAAAALMVGGFFHTPARAADLGGDCCADLEERVAELEATTARKGTKKVSLAISGQLNKFLLFWDDGKEENLYAGQDSTYSSSRVRFVGNGKITEDVSAGYNVEFELIIGQSATASQIQDNGGGLAPIVRQNYLYLKDKRYGEVRLGYGSTAIDDISFINTAAYGYFTEGDWHDTRGFFTRGSNGILTGVSIGNLSGCYLDTSTTAFDCPITRRQNLQYVSPEIMGFTFNASYGEDNFEDIALRFKKDFEKFKVAAGVGYGHSSDERENNGAGGGVAFDADTSSIQGSASALHIPTGLYATFGFNHSEINEATARGGFTGKPRPDGNGYYIEAGIKRKFNDFGPTGFFGTYATTDNQLGGIGCHSTNPPFSVSNPNRLCDGLTSGFNGAFGVGTVEVDNSELNRWGIGAVQTFDAASFDLYILYEHTDFDVRVVNANLQRINIPLEDFQSVIVGGRILF